MDRWIAWLCDEREQGRLLADATVRRIVAPARSCLATAKRELLEETGYSAAEWTRIGVIHTAVNPIARMYSALSRMPLKSPPR